MNCIYIYGLLLTGVLLQLVKLLPEKLDPKTLTLSNAPSGGDDKLLMEIARAKVSQIGLK